MQKVNRQYGSCWSHMLKVPETEVGERVPVLKDFPHPQPMKRFVNEWKTFINKLPPLKTK